MRRLLLLASLTLASAPAQAQLVAPLTTPDGKVACAQGLTGVGRAPDWQAVEDRLALGGWALAEMASDPTDLRFPLCISTQTVARDLDATLRFTLVSGSHEQAAGLVLRAQSANDYYVAKASALDGGSVRLYRVAGGRRAELGAKQVPLKIGQQYVLRVVAKRDKFEVFLDGASLFRVTDRSLMVVGPVGVWSQSDSVTNFQSLLVAPAP
jgi:hypothetical protein